MAQPTATFEISSRANPGAIISMLVDNGLLMSGKAKPDEKVELKLVIPSDLYPRIKKKLGRFLGPNYPTLGPPLNPVNADVSHKLPRHRFVFAEPDGTQIDRAGFRLFMLAVGHGVRVMGHPYVRKVLLSRERGLPTRHQGPLFVHLISPDLTQDRLDEIAASAAGLGSFVAA